MTGVQTCALPIYEYEKRLIEVAQYRSINKLLADSGIIDLSDANYAYLSSVKSNFMDLCENEIYTEIQKFETEEKSVNWAIDPSGYVYEAVTSNRIKGVKCEAYYLDEETGEAVLWNAEEYNQANPIYTDSLGQYAWDVPEGKWKVIYSKDSYETVSTDWLDVPPPQTEVNIGMVSKEVPKPKIKSVESNKVVIEFSKYMDPDTLSSITLSDNKGKEINTIFAYSSDEKSVDGKVYAKEFILTPSKELEEYVYYYVDIDSGLKSYANVSAEEESIEISWERYPEDNPDNTKLGDINADGIIDTEDARMIFKYYIGAITLTEEQMKIADVNKDNEIDTEDARKILLYCVGQNQI